jgi:hypothetical protein
MIYVIGCNHGIQPGGGIFSLLDSAECQEQRAHFRELIEHILREGEIQFIGEEWGDTETTSTQDLAARSGIAWRNINTSDADKDRMGIPRDYATGPCTEEQKALWNGQREQFMLERIREYQAEAQKLLIICGFTHLESLTELLAQGGKPIQSIDYRTRDWYRPGVFVEDP